MNKALILMSLVFLMTASVVLAATGVTIDKPAAGAVINLNSTGKTNIGIRVLDQNEKYYNVTTNVSLYIKCLQETSWRYSQSIINTTNNQTTWNVSWNVGALTIDGTCDIKADIRNVTGQLIGGAAGSATLNSDTNLDWIANKTSPTVAFASTVPSSGSAIENFTTVFTCTSTEELSDPMYIYFDSTKKAMTRSNASNMKYSFTASNVIADGWYNNVYCSYKDSAGGGYKGITGRGYKIDRSKGNILLRQEIANSGIRAKISDLGKPDVFTGAIVIGASLLVLKLLGVFGKKKKK